MSFKPSTVSVTPLKANDRIVEILRDALTRAEDGKTCGLAVVEVLAGGQMVRDFEGDLPCVIATGCSMIHRDICDQLDDIGDESGL